MKAGSNAIAHGVRWSQRLLVLALVAATSLASSAALGQEAPKKPTTAEVADAQRHFDQGVEAARAGKWPEAREAFAKAYALSPQLKYLALLSSAEMKTDRNRDAAQHLATLLKRKAEIPDQNTIPEARKMLADLKATVGTAKIHVNIEGAEVFVDGVSKGRSPLEDDVFVDPGQRTFEAKKDGFTAARIVMDVKAGSEPVVELELRKEEQGRSGGPNKKLVYTGIIVTGSLALVGGLGIITNNALFAKADGLDRPDGCSGLGDCNKKFEEFKELHSIRIPLNYVAIGAGIGAGIAGAATLIYWLKTKKHDDGAPRAALMVGPGGGALVFTGRF